MAAWIGTQLLLPVEPHENQTFKQFLEGSDSRAKAMLVSFLEQDADTYLFVTGGEGLGKSHLLQASYQLAMKLGKSALYLSCQDYMTLGGRDVFTPSMLEGLEDYDLVCIDDVSLMFQMPDMEEALFHFFNRMKEGHKQLIIADRQSLTELPVRLPDLMSRLKSGLVLKLSELSDEEKKKLLIEKALEMGFVLELDVVEFLMKRSDRSVHTLTNKLKVLGKASLSLKRKVTIPFVKEVLGL
jgi:DnaA family protein